MNEEFSVLSCKENAKFLMVLYVLASNLTSRRKAAYSDNGATWRNKIEDYGHNDVEDLSIIKKGLK